MMSKSKANSSGSGTSGSGGEDVLLYMKHVRHKKANGGLFLLSSRLGWMEEEKNNKFVANIHYADIKMQKISAAGKVKVQLQIVLHNGESSTFHFNNPAGYDEQVSDREKVKDMLQQMIPKFRSQVDQDLKRKLQVLKADPKMFQLYKDLVVGGIIPAEEFWQNVASDSLKGPPGTGGDPDEEEHQDMGVSSGFLAEMDRPPSPTRQRMPRYNGRLEHALTCSAPQVLKHMNAAMLHPSQKNKLQHKQYRSAANMTRNNGSKEGGYRPNRAT